MPTLVNHQGIIFPDNTLQTTAARGAIVSETPPPNPLEGQVWWDSTNLIMFLYYDDAWLEVGGGGGGGGTSGGGETNPVQVMGSEGYQIFSNGLIIQWGSVYSASPSQTLQQTVTLPIAFPNMCVQVLNTLDWASYSSHAAVWTKVKSVSNTQIVFEITPGGRRWMALGF